MDKTRKDSIMDFQNVNSLNILMNKLSGNLFPVTERGSPFTLFWKLYAVMVTVSILPTFILLIAGCINVSKEKLMQDGLICLATYTEVTFMVIKIHAYRNLMRQLIRKLNQLLHAADETMKNIVRETFEPTKMPLKFYMVAGILSTLVWCLLPFMLIPERSVFWNEDYKMPAFFPNQPFSLKTFVLYSLFLTVTCTFIVMKKIAVDMYMIHLVMLITAQYRYVATKTAMILQGHEQKDDRNTRERRPSEVNQKQEKEIMAICRHHNMIIRITYLLKELLSLNFSLIYVNNIFRFSIIGIMVSGIASTSTFETSLIVFFMSGSIVQLYIMCSSVQKLLDASIEITDKAFHETWYSCKRSIISTFLLMIMANNLECKVAKVGAFNLSLPSFMKILNQSYSIALILSRFN